ncbi:hypothetical protein K2173_000792 [Erythroxylum novogranatense]|uniref:Dof zinc finger protein n=1 Tax=Erythroxylum novogranatense TaxID=1862640 RepID=A0AAV8T3I1_9ROSI|nr:hypothetical protein K2173_000792 [Erythroxylum novogranatense]
MLGNCENMVVISPTTNEWSQNLKHIDEKSLMASTITLMEKPSQEQLPPQPPQQHQPLKCPRCDSSNTKFCYYNNYSLSQPRHFCKACKRYWTRGGTLRNVPVGGGCRKNKRVKRPASALETTTSVSSTNPNTPQTQVDVVSSASNHVNPLFYGLPGNPSEVNLSYPGRFNSRVSSSVDTLSGYDLQPQLNTLAIGFSSGLLTSDANGLNTANQIHDLVSSNSLLSSYSIFGSSSSTTSSSPKMASLLGPSLHQQKFINEDVKDSRAPIHFQNLTAFDDMRMRGNNVSGIVMKEEKIEQGQNRLEWNLPCQNQIEQISFSSDPSIYWNSATSVGAWHDQANIGSSVTSLI